MTWNDFCLAASPQLVASCRPYQERQQCDKHGIVFQHESFEPGQKWQWCREKLGGFNHHDPQKVCQPCQCEKPRLPQGTLKAVATNGFSPHILLETQLSSEVQKANPTQQELPTSATTQRGVMTLSRRPMHGKKGPELKPAGTRLMNIPKPSSSIHFLGFLAIIHCYRNHTGISFVFIKIRI